MRISPIKLVNSTVKPVAFRNEIKKTTKENFKEGDISFQGKINGQKIKRAAKNGVFCAAAGAFVGTLGGMVGLMALTVGLVGVVGTLLNDED